MARLPVDDILPAVLEAVRAGSNLVIEAPPGAGKTTRIPPALLACLRGEVVVLEPRRIAARLAARRVSSELGERVGETVGYQVRFEDVSGPRTRLRFVTEGVLNRRLLTDSRLNGVAAVILDEFHERHLDGDLALALLKRLQETARPDLKIVVMSATLEAAPVARFLGGCPILRSEGRLFDLEIAHLHYSAKPFEEQVADAVEALIDQRHSGDVLVFLPGVAEIRRAARACEPLARRHDFSIAPLYGDLSPAEQDRAIEPGARRKIILSTNVAESSITIEGVSAVIDSGLARIASDSPWTGLPTLDVGRVSKASAIQRAGRAARTAPGKAIRLYTAEDFHRRAAQDTPEILCRELSQLCLDLRALDIADPLALAWLDAPPEPSVRSAESLLERLGAFGPAARRMARYPLHPTLAKLVLEASDRGAAGDGCAAAALLSSGVRPPATDLQSSLDSQWEPRTRQIYDQLRGISRAATKQRAADALAKAVLCAFPDRVARRRRDDLAMLSNGVSAQLPAGSHTSEFFVAVDVEDRSERSLPLIRLTSPIEPDWLLDLFPDRVEAQDAVEWNRTAERVEAVSTLRYDQLVIEETRGGAPDPELAATLLARQAMQAGIERFVNADDLMEVLARIEFAAEHAAVARPDPEAILQELCQGLRSFAELERSAASLPAMLEQRANAALLSTVAPSRITLPSGRQTRIHYELGQPPWVASRLQDFFGMRDTPRVANGKVPVVVRLLAPNQRPVQTTTDLAGFWSRLYPQLRRELSRRYPKQAWPEQPG